MWFKGISLLILIIICGGITMCNAGPTLPRLMRRNVHELHIPVAIVSDHVEDADLNNKEIIQRNEENRIAIEKVSETLEAAKGQAKEQASSINENDNDNDVNNKIRNDQLNDDDDNHHGEMQNQIVHQNERDHENEKIKNLPETIEEQKDQTELHEPQQLKGENIKEVFVQEKPEEYLTNKAPDTQLVIAANDPKILNEENRNELNKEVTADQDKIIALNQVQENIKDIKNINEKLDNKEEGAVNAAEKDDVVLRQSSADNAAASTTTQANFVQQFIQNSPLGPLFNQFTGQQNVNDAGTTSAPPFFNPIQSVVNSTTQAFQGFQQFANNLGQQFQNTLSSLGGQQPAQGDSTTQRPAGPIQQLVSNFIGGGQNVPNDQQQPQQQPQPQQQGPLQTLFTNIFQGGQRPQTSNTANVELSGSTTSAPVPYQPQIVEEDHENVGDKDQDPQAVVDNNQLRNSDEIEDSFEQNIKSEEQIVVDDDDNDDHDQPKSDRQQTRTAANTIA